DPAFRAEASTPPTAQESAPRPPLRVRTLRSLLELVRRHPGRFAHKLRSGEPRRVVQRFVDSFPHASLSWADVAFLRGLTRLPLLLKGVLRPDDATRAVSEGVDGIIVSNHGGRQIDGGVAALDALPRVVAAVDGAVPVLLDSGVRGGADAFKALALGAAAAGIGRPYMYGLAVAGEAGVREVLRNFVAELDLTMAVTGCRSVAEIGCEILVREG
ncbi:MAG TPA: alpha-hydroxy-acid oxidizing protein, partial [Longimicrobiales bacterium]|nr:alpha-hydroxy-acid oxidizing protein [Longimicrobiales bacterium]